MAKIMVFQHVPYEPLGTLDPLIRSQRHRIRYVNFGRNPDAQPSIEGYDALIILGGPMNIGQEAEYPHLDVEKQVIREAIEQNIPILGICLGAQLIAAALGAEVYRAKQSEIGWYKMLPTIAGRDDSVTQAFGEQENIFQWHGYTFDLPKDAELLIQGEEIVNQAYRVKDNVYGFQFHLEASSALIQRWLNLPVHQRELGLDKSQDRIAQIKQQTENEIARSLSLSEKVFGAFLAKLPKVNEKHCFNHRHF
ncbi:glutamine amidotransferase-related protein [Aliikangiella coralliicola]|uniref:Amidotransferase n=1 Tax=Aliikangiella coralliicola TaxID=2592383 RepID=A0A545U0D2_9GAMM|nr:gamma-glutamyl-gamma-aminobutyrate hydrolase family protein [Aliikangiella coralliicola]TQV82927.1 amidotransferase [Aliikangiella coralliicola]